jgi:hypothetical protein
VSRAALKSRKHFFTLTTPPQIEFGNRPLKKPSPSGFDTVETRPLQFLGINGLRSLCAEKTATVHESF